MIAMLQRDPVLHIHCVCVYVRDVQTDRYTSIHTGSNKATDLLIARLGPVQTFAREKTIRI